MSMVIQRLIKMAKAYDRSEIYSPEIKDSTVRTIPSSAGMVSQAV